MHTYRVARYAVRGTVAVRAGELKAELARGDALPFDKLILCNIGNPHAVQQKPITYYRQALAPCAAPLRHAPRATAGCVRTQKQRTTMAPTTHPPRPRPPLARWRRRSTRPSSPRRAAAHWLASTPRTSSHAPRPTTPRPTARAWVRTLPVLPL